LQLCWEPWSRVALARNTPVAFQVTFQTLIRASSRSGRPSDNLSRCPVSLSTSFPRPIASIGEIEARTEARTGLKLTTLEFRVASHPSPLRPAVALSALPLLAFSYFTTPPPFLYHVVCDASAARATPGARSGQLAHAPPSEPAAFSLYSHPLPSATLCTAPPLPHQHPRILLLWVNASAQSYGRSRSLQPRPLQTLNSNQARVVPLRQHSHM